VITLGADALSVATIGLAVVTAALASAAFLQLRDSVRGRADALGPRVTIVALRPFWPASQPAQFLDGEDQQWPFGTTFDLPKDGDLQIKVKGLGCIINDGDTVTVTIPEHITFEVPELEPAGIEVTATAEYLSGQRYVVPARNTIAFGYAITRSVEQWAAAYDADPVSFELTVGDQRATGIEDTFRIQVLAFPLERDPQLQGRWMVPRGHIEVARHDHVEVAPANRRYRRRASRVRWWT
jgi:hypothetical protein